MAEIISGLFLKIGPSLFTSLLKAGYEKLVEAKPIQKAIEEVKKRFPNFELENALRKWTESDTFRSIASSIARGERNFSDEHVIESFIVETEFYDGETTCSSAGKILTCFFEELVTEIIRSPDGLVAFASRQEILHTETRIHNQNEIRAVGSDIIKATLAAIQTSDSDKSITPQEAQERVYHARINEAVEILKSGKPQTAKERLEILRQEIADKNPSQSTLFRIATNLGACAIQLDDTEKLKVEFNFAYQLESNNPKAIANYCAVLLLQGANEEALRLADKARNLSAQDPVATANYILALFALGRESDFTSLLESEEWIRRDPNCCSAIGQTYLDKDRYKEAEEYARKAFQFESDEPRILLLVAQCVVRPIKQSLLGKPILRGQIKIEFDSQLNEAENLLTKAISLQESTETRWFLAFSYVLRADIRQMVDNESGALADCEAALVHEPDNKFAHQIRALCLLNLGRFTDAISSFEKAASLGLGEQTLLPLAAAHIAAEQPTKVVALLESPSSTGVYVPPLPNHVDLLLAAYDAIGDKIKAGQLISELSSNSPNDPYALAAIARHYLRTNKKEEAIAYFTNALSYASEALGRLLALELGDLYYSANDFGRAANLYDQIVDKTTDYDLKERYLVCLYNSGTLHKAIQFAQTLRTQRGSPPTVCHIEARILMEIGDLPSAQAIFEELFHSFPKRYAYLVEAAKCAIRRGQTEKAKALVSSLDLEMVKDNAKVLMPLAQLRFQLGLSDVLEFAYQARRVSYSDPLIQLAYFALFTQREHIDSGLLHPIDSGVNCAIILATSNGQIIYTLLDDNNLFVERGEISMMQARDLNLIGRRAGDEINVNSSLGMKSSAIVLEVQSKYVRAFQETFEKFSALFPTTPFVHRLEGKPDEIKEILTTQLSEAESLFRRILEPYEAKKINIESVARNSNRSVIALWSMLLSRRYCKVSAFSGCRQEAQEQAKYLATEKPLVVELTAFLTLAQLGLLDRLAVRFKRLMTTQHVLDAVITEINSNSHSSPHLSVGMIHNELVSSEVTAEQLAANVKFFEGIREFILSKVEIVPVPSSLELNDSKLDEVRNFIPISVSCVLAARDGNCILFSDDEILRNLARNTWNVDGVWTQNILAELKQAGVLSPDEFIEAVGKLVLFNYQFVLISAEVVMWILRKTDFKITPDAKAFIEVFKGPKCTLESAADVLAEVTKSVWLEALLYEKKIDILNEVLSAIVDGRPIREAVDFFQQVLVLKFHLMANAFQAIQRHIRIWYRQRIDRTGLILGPNHD